MRSLQIHAATGTVPSAYWTNTKGSPVSKALKYADEAAYNARDQQLKLCAQLEGTKTPTAVKFDLKVKDNDVAIKMTLSVPISEGAIAGTATKKVGSADPVDMAKADRRYDSAAQVACVTVPYLADLFSPAGNDQNIAVTATATFIEGETTSEDSSNAVDLTVAVSGAKMGLFMSLCCCCIMEKLVKSTDRGIKMLVHWLCCSIPGS